MLELEKLNQRRDEDGNIILDYSLDSYESDISEELEEIVRSTRKKIEKAYEGQRKVRVKLKVA
jgi:glutathione peroxidase-family protein